MNLDHLRRMHQIAAAEYEAAEAEDRVDRLRWYDDMIALGDAAAEIERLRVDLDEAEDENQRHREARTCVTCGGTICPPMQCGPCIERGEIPEGGAPWLPVTATLRSEIERLRKRFESEQHRRETDLFNAYKRGFDDGKRDRWDASHAQPAAKEVQP